MKGVKLTGYRGDQVTLDVLVEDVVGQGRALDGLRQQGPFSRLQCLWPESLGSQTPALEPLPAYLMVRHYIEAPLVILDAACRLDQARSTRIALCLPTAGGSGLSLAILAFWQAWREGIAADRSVTIESNRG